MTSLSDASCVWCGEEYKYIKSDAVCVDLFCSSGCEADKEEADSFDEVEEGIYV